MANEDQGREGILPDFAALWNGSEGFAFPPLHDGVDFRMEDTSSFSLTPLQLPPSPVESIHGDPVNHVSHPPVENLRRISSSLDQISKPSMSSVLDLSLPRDMFSAQNDQIVSLSALNGWQSNGMNSTSRLNEVHSKTNVKLLTGFRSAIENLYGTGGQENGNDAGLLLDINSNPFDDDGKPCSVNHGASTSAPQHDGSTFDGRFLSLGHENSASSGWGSFAFPGDSSVNRLSLNSEKLVPGGTAGCLTLSHDDYGNLPALTSGFDLKPTLTSSKPQSGVHQFMATENRSMEMGNNKNSGYTDTGPRAFQTTPSVSSNGQFGSSEPRRDWRVGFPYDFVSSRSSQQPHAEEQNGINLRNNISSFQSSTSVIAGKDQLDQASQRHRHLLPLDSSFPPPVGAAQGVSVVRSDLTLNSNSECNPSLKRSSSSFLNVTPRKIMRQHAPPNLYVHPTQPQSSMMNLPSVYPQSSVMNFPSVHPQSSTMMNLPSAYPQSSMMNFPSAYPQSSMMNLPSVYPQNSTMNLPSVYPQNPAFSNFSHPPHHPFPPQAQFTSLQNTSSNNMLARAVPPFARSAGARNLNAYPSFSPTITNNNIRPLQRSSSLSSPSQIALLQNALENSSPAFNPLTNAFPKTEPQPPYHPPFVSNPPVSAAVNYGPSFNHAAASSLPVSTTYVPVLPVATSRVPAPPVTLERNPGYGKAPATGSSVKTATKEGSVSALKNSAAYQRFLQRQSQALAAFGKRSPALGPAASTSSIPHIKWQGTDKPEASGFKCLLCKRDLAYTPEGPISIPDFSPEVAVLPCGHTFHDTCLQAITPQDQSSNPPCIPCSITDPSA